MSLKLGTGLGLFIAVILVVFVGLQLVRGSRHSPPRWIGAHAKLPCLANKQCPVGQKCSGGFCSEGFMASVMSPSVDMSSCGAKECDGINAACTRRASPCPEGTFCQKNNCINIAAPNQGAAYNQIGLLLS